MDTTIYSNVKMYSPDNILMCYISNKKANWYLKRNLAEIIDSNAIKLKFQPDGLGKSNDPYYTQKLPNRCVVCGSYTCLTKHHIIPYCFRRYFPDHYKNHLSHDVLPLCIHCHGKYETIATSYKLQMMGSCETEEKKQFYQIWKNARTLFLYSNQMPEKKKMELRESVKNYFQMEDVSNKIEEIAVTSPPQPNTDWKYFVESLNNIGEFIVLWRNNFVNTMQPQFLPPHWNPTSRLQLEQIENGNKRN